MELALIKELNIFVAAFRISKLAMGNCPSDKTKEESCNGGCKCVGEGGSSFFNEKLPKKNVTVDDNNALCKPGPSTINGGSEEGPEANKGGLDFPTVESKIISRYYCGPCSIYVPKRNVIKHEDSSGHRKNRAAWVDEPSEVKVRNCKRDPQQDCGGAENNVYWFSGGNENHGDSKPVDWNVWLESSLQVLKSGIEMYFSLDKAVYKMARSGKFCCSLCKVEADHFPMLIHVTRKEHLNVSHGAQKYTVGEWEEKIKILQVLLEVKMSLRGVSKMCISRVRGVIQLSKEQNNRKSTRVDIPQKGKWNPSDPKSRMDSHFVLNSEVASVESTTNDLSSSFSTDLTTRAARQEIGVETCDAPEGKKHEQSENFSKLEGSSHGCILSRHPQTSKDHVAFSDPSIIAIVGNMREGMSTPLIGLPFEKASVNGVDTCSSIYCDDNSVPIEGQSWSAKWALDQADTKISEEKIQEAIEEYLSLDGVLSHYQNIYRCPNCTVESDVITVFQHTLSKEHLKIAEKQMLGTLCCKVELLAFLELARTQSESKLLPTDVCMLVRAMESIQKIVCLKKSSLKRSLKVEPNVEKSSMKPYVLEKTSSSHAPSILDENSKVMSKFKNKEDSDQICVDGGISELECETCGVVFTIFNEDIDLSVDMHVQNDPAHSLATAVPIERNAQAIAETAKSSSSRQSVKSQLASQKIKELSHAEARGIVISEILLLEQKFVVVKDDWYLCELCGTRSRSACQMCHHILLQKHMSDKWFDSLTYEDSQHWIQILSSLIKYKYAAGNIAAAVRLIKDKSLRKWSSFGRTQRYPSKETSLQAVNVETAVESMVFVPSSSEKSVSPVAVEVFSNDKQVCDVCLKDVTHMSVTGRKNHLKMCKTLYHCEVCNVRIHKNNKQSHLKGKSHKSKKAILDQAVPSM